jgi:hypothetical protein
MAGRIGSGLARLSVALAVLPPIAATGPGSAVAVTDLHSYTVSAKVAYQVTLAARLCDRPSRIRGGQTHGDTSESAGQLGDPAPYAPGASVDPAVEAQLQQGCQPLVGWRFSIGGATGKNGPLSVVGGVVAAAGPTVASVPQLDGDGAATGATVAGAVTVTLSADQLAKAGLGALWVQGGAPADPLLAKAFSGYGFGTLRCGLDTDNDDNLARVVFPAGVRHVYCYAYYTSGAPATGTVVVKLGFSQPLGAPIDVAFTGDLSYRPGGGFALRTDGSAAVQQAFVRPADHSYSVTVQPPPGWGLGTVACVGPSPTSVTPANPTVGIQLAAGTTVTCEYTLSPGPLVGLAVAAVSFNGAAAFTYAVTGPAAATLTATTTADGQPALAAGATGGPLPPGDYAITQSPLEGWTLAAVICDGQSKPLAGNGVALTVGARALCVFRNVRTAPSVHVQLTTTGGTGTGAFVLSSRMADGGSWSVGVTTSADGTVAAGQSAQPGASPGGLPAAVPPGGYRLVAVPPPTTSAGTWALDEFSCPEATGSAEGAVALTLTTGAVTCSATFSWRPAVELRVVRHVAGSPSARSGQSELSIDCTDGGLARLVMDESDTEGELAEPLRFTLAAQCTLTLTRPALVPDATISSEIAIDSSSGPVQLPTQFEVSLARSTMVVSLTDTYFAPGVGQGDIDTGKLPIKPVAVIATALALLGFVTLIGLFIVALRARHRAHYR